ncbi:MAG: helix-turn-helix domain-containing protein [Arenicellales bacterium]
MNYDPNGRRGPGDYSTRQPADDLPETGRDLTRQRQHPESEFGAAGYYLSKCALIAQPSDWTSELESLGVSVFKRPEALYKALRGRAALPELCIVDLESVPRNLVRAVDIRIPCPKMWIGKSAANPSDIKNFGVYYSKSRPEEFNVVAERLVATERSMMLPMGIVGKQMLPLLVADEDYRERLHHYGDQFANANLITLHGDDPDELQLVAQYLAVETERARIWEVKSEVSIHSVLRRIAQARRPGSDVSIVLSREIDTDSAREFYKSMPSEYSVIKLADRETNPVDALSFTLPRPVERPDDVDNWAAWFVCRATIEYGIALSGLPELVFSIGRMIGENPTIDEIRAFSERSVRQHAIMMEDHAEFMPYEDLVHNFERTLLRQALAQHEWNLSAAARSLGLAESSLRYKLNKLGVNKGESND